MKQDFLLENMKEENFNIKYSQLSKRGQARCCWPGPAQHIYIPNHFCRPIGECLHQIPLFLLVDARFGL